MSGNNNTKRDHNVRAAFLNMQREAVKAGTYSRLAAYREANCLKTVKFEDKGGGYRISGSTEVIDEKCADH